MKLSSLFGLGPSIWDDRRRRAMACIAYRAGEKHLIKNWPAETEQDEDGLAVALGKLRASLGY